MKARKVTLVVIDDDPELLSLVSLALSSEGSLHVIPVTDALQGLDLVRRLRPQIILVDLVMPGVSGMDLLQRIVEIDPSLDVVLMTAHYTTESAVEAIRIGACDYLNKPFTPDQLRARIAPLLAEATRRQRAQHLDGELLENSRFEGIVGRGASMLEVFARIRRIAPYYRTALITGATGTGKELAAIAIHRLSPASSGPFVICNCAAIPESLVESELFGHVRGAFTGAVADKAGLFETAGGGTLFLDEIGEVPPGAQAKLLRAMQSLEFRRVGSASARQVDARIICATNRDLRREVEQKNFREDLFYRVSMIEIRMPDLCERREDLPLLVRHFILRFSRQYGKDIEGITRRAEAALFRHTWSGNVRELENVIGYACMMTDTTRIDACDLPAALFAAPRHSDYRSEELISLEEMDRLHTRRVLEAVGGDKLRAAEILGVSRSTLYRLLGSKAAGESN